MSEQQILADEADYPSEHLALLGRDAPVFIDVVGAWQLLNADLTALFVSMRCDGNLILKSDDLAAQLRDAGVATISGFPTPVEKPCLKALLRGQQQIGVSPARSLATMRVPAGFAQALEQGRLPIVSPFADHQRHATVETAFYRNRFVAALASKIVILHSEPSSKTEALCREALGCGNPVYTLASLASEHLVAGWATGASGATLASPLLWRRPITEVLRL